MAVIISGSLAYDTVFEHRGRFADSLLPDELDRLNLTFQAESMRRTFGGCAGNIAYSLKQLGGDPLIWTAVGGDAGAILEHLRAQQMRTDGITVISSTFSAQAIITTDTNGCQLTTFYSGAMDYAHQIPFPEFAPVTLGILAPTTHEPLLAHAALFRKHHVPYLLDTGQTTPLFSGEELLSLAREALAVCFSEYEAGLYREKTGCTPQELSRLGCTVFCTAGARGSTVYEKGVASVVEAAPAQETDPVGAGDAYRGGILRALELGLPSVVAARMGSLVAARKVSVAGPHYCYSFDELCRDYETVYGETLTPEPAA